MSIGVKKLDMYEGITVKTLLDSGATGMLMNKRMAAKHGFKLQKLKRPIMVRNVNKINNSDVINLIWPYLHQFFNNFHGLKGYRKPSKIPFN